MQSSATNGASALAPGPARSAVVLIVDDYQDCREMYGACLTLAGFEVVTAADGLAALALARHIVPDLILMDIGLPGIDGFETTRQLKLDPLTRDVPVLAFTAQCPPDDESVRRTGFVGVITKPCRPDDLADRIGQVLHAAR